MSYKKYSCTIFALSILFLVLNLFLWHFVVSKTFFTTDDGHGDLTRLGCLPQIAFTNKNPEYKNKHVEFQNYLANEQAYNDGFDIITIGSSCSNGGGGAYYQDYLTDHYGLKVLNVQRDVPTAEALMIISESGYLDKFKPDYVILECVERYFYDIRTWEIKPVKNARTMLNLLDKKTMRFEKGKFFEPIMVNANLTYAFALVYRLLHNDRMSLTTYVASLNENCFDCPDDERTLYYYYEDLNYLHKKFDMAAANDSLNKIADYLAERNIKLIFLGLPNKHSLYFPLIKNNTLPENTAFDDLEPLEKRYTFVNAKAIEREALLKDHVTDIFWCDDTHWSYKGHKLICDYIVKNVIK